MATCSKALIALSITALLAGAVVLVFTAMALRYVAWDDVHLLTTRYDPNADAAYRDLRTYEGLYPLTERFLHDRNHFRLWFHYTLGTFFVAVGALLIAWTVDRERLRRRV